MPCLQKLVLHMLDLLGLAQNGKPSLAVANALHMVAVTIKFVVETCSPSSLTMVFEVVPNLPAAVQGEQAAAARWAGSCKVGRQQLQMWP